MNGRLTVNVTTGSGFGFITFETVGQTSRRRAGGVAQIAASPPTSRGLAVGPHAINPGAGASTVMLYGRGYPSTTVNLYRNGTMFTSVAVGASGRFFLEAAVAATADTSAVYSVDDGTAGSMVGQSIEERSDAGPAPLGDRNATRGSFDRAVLNATGGPVALVGDGFVPLETVPVSGCASGTDGVLQGTQMTSASGNATFGVNKPPAGFVHTISWVAQDGTSDAQAATLLLFSGLKHDRDHDAMTDRTIVRPSTNVWFSALSDGGATATGWGVAGDVDVLGDYDGDGTADIAVWRPSTGTWFIVPSTSGVVRAETWGQSGDIPLAGDVDGDGKDDLVIFRGTAGAWFYKKSTGGTVTLGWGLNGDQPVLADFDRDGKHDAVAYRPTTAVWYVAFSAGGSSNVGWGTPGDVPVAGDWDGDAIADHAIFRASTGNWFIKKSTGGTQVVAWGVNNDIPLSGDWDGDGSNEFTVWRPSNGVWYTQFSSGGSAVIGWGVSGDKPSGRLAGT